MILRRGAIYSLALPLLCLTSIGCTDQSQDDGISGQAPDSSASGGNCNSSCNCNCEDGTTASTGSTKGSGTGVGGTGSKSGSKSGASTSTSSNSPGDPDSATQGGSGSTTKGGSASGTKGGAASATKGGSSSTTKAGSTAKGGASGTTRTSNPSAGGSASTTASSTKPPSGAGMEFTPPADAKPTPESSGVNGKFRVNSTGKLTADGKEFQLRGGNWFGLEGQDDLQRPGAMELYIGSVFWADAANKRTIEQTMKEITASPLSFNTIRLPIAPQTLVKGHPDGDYTRSDVKIRNNDPEKYPYNDAREALEDFIKQAAKNNLYVILDIHSCSNHIGWRAGWVDDKPPWTDADRENYKYKKEDKTCRGGEDDYTLEKWLADVRTLAQLPKDLGVNNILGIDCFNEPFKYSWSEWADLATLCYEAMAEVNDDLIAFVEGVSGTHWNHDDDSKSPEPFGPEDTTNPNWGENLYGQQFDPIQIPKDRLCFAPHTYGPSVYVQTQFIDQSDPACVGLEDDAAGKAKCKLVVERSNKEAVEKLRKGWDDHFGYLRKDGYCVMIGEFGGTKTWPDNPVDPDAATVWAHLPKATRYDFEWQNIFVDYMKDIGLTDFTYWSINPESGDTGGLYNHAYSKSNESGWGVWNGFDTEKTGMLGALK
ncbi:MAG TPA: cellulase family glycosylhydrolase [Polyangiaceae bacterium]|nr:cellulase family glycosylhydrolase [Polyangiaceae bacterium]